MQTLGVLKPGKLSKASPTGNPVSKSSHIFTVAPTSSPSLPHRHRRYHVVTVAATSSTSLPRRQRRSHIVTVAPTSSPSLPHRHRRSCRRCRCRHRRRCRRHRVVVVVIIVIIIIIIIIIIIKKVNTLPINHVSITISITVLLFLSSGLRDLSSKSLQSLAVVNFRDQSSGVGG